MLQWGTLISQTWGVFSLHASVASLRLTPEGKKSLSWEEFVHGYMKK
jgi:hypothetical protein